MEGVQVGVILRATDADEDGIRAYTLDLLLDL
jgi:hypothetical protein